jgi:Ca2+-binding RTX toxin-like protein
MLIGDVGSIFELTVRHVVGFLDGNGSSTSCHCFTNYFNRVCAAQENSIMTISNYPVNVSADGHAELVLHDVLLSGSPLDAVLEAIVVDAGLNPAGNDVRHAQTVEGARAAAGLNQLIYDAMTATGVSADGNISVDDVVAINAWIRGDAGRLALWTSLHGDDENGVETGFHLIQGDGGTTEFRGLNFVNTVLDGIYHLGFAIENGRLLNEDGDQNATLLDVANWLNAFALGNSNVNGTAGDDALSSGQSSSIFSVFDHEMVGSGEGNDVVNAGAGNDRVYGGSGNDTLVGGTGDDVVSGDDGNDYLNGGAGDDVVIGAAGDDTLYGDSGNDLMSGNDGNDNLFGEDGNDTLMGGAGDDNLYGGDGADVLNAGDGNGYLDGGVGDDTLIGGNGHNVMYGGAGDDAMTGGADYNIMYGGTGNDVMTGGGDNDQLHGDDGDDVLIGGAGVDMLFGGGGADVLNGGAGADILELGVDGDADIIVFNSGDSAAYDHIDQVFNFDHGEDRIDLSGFGGLQFVAGGFTGNGHEVTFDGENMLIDANADGITDMAVHFAGQVTLTSGDFIF